MYCPRPAQATGCLIARNAPPSSHGRRTSGQRTDDRIIIFQVASQHTERGIGCRQPPPASNSHLECARCPNPLTGARLRVIAESSCSGSLTSPDDHLWLLPPLGLEALCDQRDVRCRSALGPAGIQRQQGSDRERSGSHGRLTYGPSRLSSAADLGAHFDGTAARPSRLCICFEPVEPTRGGSGAAS